MKSVGVVVIVSLIWAGEVLRASGSDHTFTIIHTNDLHANFRPNKQGTGGLALLAGYVNQTRAKSIPVLLVDCGDRIVKGDLFVHNSKGVAAYKALESLHYDAYALGNTDLAFGLSGIEQFKQATETPILAANLALKDGALLADQAGLIKTVGKVRVALIGVLYSPPTDDPLTQKLGSTVTFTDPVPTILDYRVQHGAEFDLLVVLSHLGWEADIALAEKLTGPTVILGAHSHTLAETPYQAADPNVVVVQAGAYCQHAGELTVDLAADKKSMTCQWRAVPLDGTAAKPDETMAALVAALETEYAPGMSDIIGAALEDFETWNSLANLTTAALRTVAQADLAFSDRGFVRDVILKGPITKEDIYRKSPYTNQLAVFLATGKQLLDAMGHNLKGLVKGRLDFSGASCLFETDNAGAINLVSTTLDPDQTYRVATSDYILKNSEFFFGQQFEYQVLETDTTSAQIRYLTEQKALTPDQTRYLNCRGCTEPDRRVKF